MPAWPKARSPEATLSPRRFAKGDPSPRSSQRPRRSAPHSVVWSHGSMRGRTTGPLLPPTFKFSPRAHRKCSPTLATPPETRSRKAAKTGRRRAPRRPSRPKAGRERPARSGGHQRRHRSELKKTTISNEHALQQIGNVLKGNVAVSTRLRGENGR